MTTRRIVCAHHTCGGQPRLAGSRLRCSDIVTLVRAHGLREFVRDYAYLTADDVKTALTYCARMVCKTDKLCAARNGWEPVHFCSTCRMAEHDDASCDVHEPMPRRWVQAKELLTLWFPEPG